ncbi:MAG: CsgG/HfaB family protein, partial [Verrucomicrobia bacterium]|nr:CsgG/HfaB family protein [Verrucomicrobiota bacterium]
MNKRILLIGGGALLVSVLAVVSVNWYLKSLEYSPALSEEQMAEAASRLRGSAPTTSATAAIPALPTSRAVRLAIGGLGLPNDAVNREVADLVVANLTGASGLELVERQALDLALREMSLSLSGLVRAQDAIRVGKLVRADWFLLGNTVRLTQTNFIVARLVDAKSGVIQNLALVGDVDQPLLVAKALASFTRRAREAAAQPDVKEFLALGHFADAGVNSRQAAFPAQLRSYLMSAYRGSRITLLEREYVDALLQEVRLDLAGLTTESPANDVRPLQSAFWIVEGLFQSQETSGFEVEVNLRITRAFDRATQQTFRGKPDENLFRQIKSAIDVALSDTKRGVYPTKLSESRLQMRAGKDLYALATGGKPMEILPPGMSLGGYAPQEPSMRRRNLEEAIRAFQTVLLLEPDNLEAKFNLAVCCHEESVGRIEEARNQF